MQTKRQGSNWWLLIIGAIAGAIWLGYKHTTEEAQRKEKDACARKDALEASVAASGLVQLSDLKVTSYSPLGISGRVHNRSNEPISELGVRVTVHDCINGRCDKVFEGGLGGMIDYPGGLLSGGAIAPGMSADFALPNDQRYGKFVSLRGASQTSVALTNVTIFRPDLPLCATPIGELLK